MFTVYRYHAVFTDSTEPMLIAEAHHRDHAIVEQVIADLKSSALKHFPSGSFNANGAWLACAVMAYNLSRAAGVLAGRKLGKARTATIRSTLINIPARLAFSAGTYTLHLGQRDKLGEVERRLPRVGLACGAGQRRRSGSSAADAAATASKVGLA